MPWAASQGPVEQAGTLRMEVHVGAMSVAVADRLRATAMECVLRVQRALKSGSIEDQMSGNDMPPGQAAMVAPTIRLQARTDVIHVRCIEAGGNPAELAFAGQGRVLPEGSVQAGELGQDT